MRTLSGGCLCGGVRFEVDEPFIRASHCHCSRCRRHSGTAVCTQARVPRQQFRLLAGAELIRTYRGGDGYAVKAFCSVCGSSLFGGSWPDGSQVSIRLGAFDDDPGIRPQFHTFVDSRAAWDEISDDLPQYPGAWSRDATPRAGAPTLVAHFRHMAANGRWSNARLQAACAELAPREYFRDRGAWFGSIHATLSHIVVIDEWYLAGLHGERASRVDYGAVVHATLAEVTRAQEEADRRLLAYCESLTATRLGEVARWSDDDGDAHAEPVYLVLAHLFVHQIHHRGQVHDLLRQTGVAPPQLDEFFLRADTSRRAEELRRLGLLDPALPARSETASPLTSGTSATGRLPQGEAAVIREYAHGIDAAALRSCFVELQDFERAFDPAMPTGEAVADAYLQRMLERCSTWDGAVFVALVRERVIGFVCVWTRVPPEPDEPPVPYAFISDLIVLPTLRGRGVGQALIAEAERYARGRGTVMLKLDVMAGNRGALRLYEAVGFTRRRLEMAKVLR